MMDFSNWLTHAVLGVCAYKIAGFMVTSFNNIYLRLKLTKLTLEELSDFCRKDIHTFRGFSRYHRKQDLINFIIQKQNFLHQPVRTIFFFETILRDISPHIAKEILEIKDNEICTICKEDINEDNAIITGCGHIYCIECRNKISECAICRRKISSFE